MNKDVARRKKEDLVLNLRDMGSLLVAFSGGVDSSFLLAVAHSVLGENVIAATANSPIHSNRERERAIKFTWERGIKHIILRSEELSLTDFVSNRADRCYHCKRSLLENLLRVARENDLKHVAHGANVDDLKDYRPGLKAARQMGIIAPFVDINLMKEEIRFLSKEMGLPTWNKPAMACLASRIPYGDSISEEKLQMVEAAEEILEEKGFTQFRVRYHWPVARIEVEGSEIKKITEPKLRKDLIEKFRKIGFIHITIDLEGYVAGSMNRALDTLKERGSGK